MGAGSLINDELGACAVKEVQETKTAWSNIDSWQKEITALTGMQWAPAIYGVDRNKWGEYEDYKWNDSNKYLLYSNIEQIRDPYHEDARRDVDVQVHYTLNYRMDCHGSKQLIGFSNSLQVQTFDRGNFRGSYSNSRNFFQRLWDAVTRVGGVSIGFLNNAGGSSFSAGFGGQLAYTTPGTKIANITINHVGQLEAMQPLTFEQAQKLSLPLSDDTGPVDYVFEGAEVVDNNDVDNKVSEFLNFDDNTAVVITDIQDSLPSVSNFNTTDVRAKDGRQIPISEPIYATRSVQRQWVSTVGSSGYYTERGVFYVIEIPSTGEKVNISAREFSKLKADGLVIEVRTQYR